MNVEVPTWVDHAACGGVDPESWFPDGPGAKPQPAVLKICNACPVKQECLDYAVQHSITDGIWGGLTYLKRLRLRPTPTPKTAQSKAPQPPKPLAPPMIRDVCGTLQGYRKHYYRGETACRACKHAHNEYRRNLRRGGAA